LGKKKTEQGRKVVNLDYQRFQLVQKKHQRSEQNLLEGALVPKYRIPVWNRKGTGREEKSVGELLNERQTFAERFPDNSLTAKVSAEKKNPGGERRKEVRGKKETSPTGGGKKETWMGRKEKNTREVKETPRPPRSRKERWENMFKGIRVGSVWGLTRYEKRRRKTIQVGRGRVGESNGRDG